MADYPISNVARRVVYTGSAGAGPYAFEFEVLENTDINVYQDDALLTLTTDYTVTINALLGTGSVTLVVPAVLANRITIVGSRPVERTTDFTTGGDFFANTLNDEMDSQTILVQQVAETAERSIKAPVTDPTNINMTLPINTSRAGKTLAFDADGNPVPGDPIGNWRGNWAASVSYQNRDIVKDTTNSNVYLVITAHTSSGALPISSNIDVAKWALVVDAAATATAQAAAEAAQAAAETAETNAETAETNAETAQTAAETAETNAETAETNAETAETNAATSETNAATSETNAATSETNASTSETNASTSASTASTQASNASTSASNASTSESNASTSASTATTQASNASTSASNASTSESNASTSASTATTQASNASTSASNAATSESNAATSASNASTSETNAAASAASVEPLPTQTGNAGKYLQTDGTDTAWEVAGDLLAANNLSDLANAATARTNLGLVIGTDVQAEVSGAVLTAVTVAATDKVLVQDASDSDNLKSVTAQSIADLGGVLQTVSVLTTARGTQALTANTEVVVTGLTINVVPRGANSKFLIQARSFGESAESRNDVYNILQDGTRVNIGGSALSYAGLSMATQTYGAGADNTSTPEILTLSTLVSTSSVVGTTITFALAITSYYTKTLYLNRCVGVPATQSEVGSSEIIVTEIGA
jgi:hypothetical protein